MKLSEIADSIGCEISESDKDIEIQKISSLKSANSSSITFVTHPKYLKEAAGSSAAVVITRPGQIVRGKVNIEVEDPYLAYAKTALLFEDRTPVFGDGIHETAVIDKSAKTGENVSVGPGSIIGSGCVIADNTVIGAGCIIENNTEIGSGCRIDSGVVIRWETKIGNDVIIQSGSVIGSDGFANARDEGRFFRIPCFGAVIIEDDVHIGACTTIDRGNFEPTLIKQGVRLDNLVHVAHNVEIGSNTAIAAQTGISGSTVIGKRVLIGGQAGFVGHISIGDDSFIGAKAGVSKEVGKGLRVTGYPARDFMKMRRIEAAQLRLPDLIKEIKKLKNEINSLKENS